MPKSIQISKQSTTEVIGISSYKFVVRAINAENMPSKIFVNQRIRNFAKDEIDDVFVAVATPTQLEDFAEDAPEAGTGYFRTDAIELIVRTPEVMQSIFDSLVYEVEKLVLDLNLLEELTNSEVYTVSVDPQVFSTPTDPIITLVTPGDTTVSIEFLPPNYDGGYPITNYEYSTNGGIAWNTRVPSSTASPILATELVNGSTYNFQIRAVNSLGVGTASNKVHTAPVAP